MIYDIGNRITVVLQKTIKIDDIIHEFDRLKIHSKMLNKQTVYSKSNVSGDIVDSSDM